MTFQVGSGIRLKLIKVRAAAGQQFTPAEQETMSNERQRRWRTFERQAYEQKLDIAYAHIAPAGTETTQPEPELARTVSRKLEGVWRLGDQDGSSIEHISCGAAAVMAGHRWEDGVALSKTPWCYDADYVAGEWVAWDSEKVASKETELKDKWAEVEALIDKFGRLAVSKAILRTKFGPFIAQDLDNWINPNGTFKEVHEYEPFF